MISFSEISEKFDIVDFIENGGHRTYVNFANYRYFRNHRLQHITSIGFDGISIVLAYNFLGGKHVKRQSFDFSADAHDFLSYCVTRQKKVCFIGGSVGDISKFKKKLSQWDLALPSWEFQTGFISSTCFDCWESYLESLCIFEFDVVVLGLGAPLQEKIGLLIASKYPRVSTITCGAFISQTANSTDLHYYPYLVNKLHLRWLYRAIKEPHVLYRLVFEYPVSTFCFALDIIGERLKYR